MGSGHEVPGESAPPSGLQQDFRGHGTILVVEDDDLVRKYVRKILVKSGYKVLEAASGSEALEVEGGYAEDIALLLTDVVMPDMNGPDMARHFGKKRPGTKTLFMSGYSDLSQYTDDLNVQENFLHKPFSPADLVGKIRLLLLPQPG